MDFQTPLYEQHVALGATMTSFAGYMLPVQYSAGILSEHNAVRTAAGLFDVSHMGEFLIQGNAALDFINHCFTNDFTNMTENSVRYSLLCNNEGGVIDDVLVYMLTPQKFLIVVNASNRQKDYLHLKTILDNSTSQSHNFAENVSLTDISDDTALLALQGPASKEILEALNSVPNFSLKYPLPLPEKYYTFAQPVENTSCTIVSQTGYTGESGYEIFLAPADAPLLWDLIMKAGKSLGILPCGLGARDTLRLEAAMPLYGHEMDDTISPLETGLGFGVKMNKPYFIGKEGILSRGEPAKKRVGLKVTGKGIARENQPVYQNGKPIGHTTSGTFAPFLKYPIAMAILSKSADLSIGAIVEIDIRGRRVEAQITELPFYKRTN